MIQELSPEDQHREIGWAGGEMGRIGGWKQAAVNRQVVQLEDAHHLRWLGLPGMAEHLRKLGLPLRLACLT